MPHTAQEMVLEFHKHMGQVIGDPQAPDLAHDQALRIELIRDEYQELKDALAANDVVEVADALGDLLYVIHGAAITWGIDLPPILEEIHASNMSKDPAATHAINAAKMAGTARPSKGPNYKDPDIAKVLKESAEFLKVHGYGEDSFWPEPSLREQARKEEIEAFKKLHEPPPVSQKLKLAAAMKSIKADFVEAKASAELAGADFSSEETTNSLPTESDPPVSHVVGEWTSYGAYIISCPGCGRNHALQGKLGSRGGLARDAKAECICGNAFYCDFTQADKKHPLVTITTTKSFGR